MPRPRIIILRAPGTNCDQETAYAFEIAGGQPDLVHINRLLENPGVANEYQVLCVPGGFSYGDDIAAGRILAGQIRLRVHDALQRYREDDKIILGICNGFQVLMKAGILPSSDSQEAATSTLTWNDSGRFEDRWVHLTTTGNQCVLLSGVQTMYLPVAHAEGKFVAQDATTLQTLSDQGQLVLRYSMPTTSYGDNQQAPYPYNPNGSMANVAGLCDPSGRILGLMPHPERYIDRTHHPRWTRESLPDKGDGLKVFENAVAYFR